MTPSTDATTRPGKRARPRAAFVVATALGLGYGPKAPGTFGAAGGALLCAGMAWACKILCGGTNQCTLVVFLAALIVVAATGVWSASAVARFTGKEDPQIVVIDEVSGQQITYLLALLLAHLASVAAGASSAQSSADFAVARLLNWKFLLAGFLLFRLFDITKPFPCRRLERLPAGWGIMADDCMAGVYAAILLWAALHFRLL